jgi:hypothetical protein
VITQTAGMVWGGNVAAAESVHLDKGADLSGVGKVIGKLTSCEAGAGGGVSTAIFLR